MKYQHPISATITAVNADGSYDVSTKGRSIDYSSLTSIDGGKYYIDDVVMLTFPEGNKNLPYIQGNSAYR